MSTKIPSDRRYAESIRFLSDLDAKDLNDSQVSLIEGSLFCSLAVMLCEVSLNLFESPYVIVGMLFKLAN